MDISKIQVEIVESNLSSETKVFLMTLLQDSAKSISTPINEDILNPTSSWSKNRQYEGYKVSDIEKHI